MSFRILAQPVDDSARILVTVAEESRKTTVGGAEGAFGSCMGWTALLAAMKVWEE